MQNSRWAALNLAKTLTHRFRIAWQNTAADQRRAWLRTLLLGFASVIAVLFASIGTLKYRLASANHFEWEERALRAIESGPFTFGNAIWFQTFGADSTLWILVLFTAGLAVWNERPLLAVSILLTWIVLDATVRLGWFAFDRTRPTVIAEGVASPGFRSFPSGHTAKTIAVYGLLAAQWIKASRSRLEQLFALSLLIVLVLVVPFGRLRTGVHWPTDVVGGWLAGGTWLMFSLLALRHEKRG